MVDEPDNRARLDVRAQDLGDLSADQATRDAATSRRSPYLVQPLQAPAGAGKTHSLQARCAPPRTAARKQVLVLAPTGKAVDEAMAKAPATAGSPSPRRCMLVERNALDVDSATWSSWMRRPWSAHRS